MAWRNVLAMGLLLAALTLLFPWTQDVWTIDGASHRVILPLPFFLHRGMVIREPVFLQFGFIMLVTGALSLIAAEHGRK